MNSQLKLPSGLKVGFYIFKYTSGADRENESFISVAISFLCQALNGFYEEDEEEELGESMRVIIYSYTYATKSYCEHMLPYPQYFWCFNSD